MGEPPCRDACWALDECFHHLEMAMCLYGYKCSFLFAKGRRRHGICEVDNFCKWVFQDTISDLEILGVINGGGYIHCQELVEQGRLEVVHVVGWGVGGRQGHRRAVGDRKHTLSRQV